MSQLWRDQIQVFFAPSRIDFVRLPKGLKTQPQSKISNNFELATDTALWKTTVEQLAQMLEKENSIRSLKGAELSITLSNHFVRYAVIQFQQGIKDAQEFFVYAQFQMREIYGDRVDSWDISMSDWDPKSGGICAALERELVQQIQALAVRFHLKLKQIEPYLTAAFDQWSRAINHQRFWFIVVEAGRLCVLLFSNSGWKSIRNQRLLKPVETELLILLEQEAIIATQREPVELAFIFAPEHSDLQLPLESGWHFNRLPFDGILAPNHFPAPMGNTSELPAHAST
ncbi:MAG: hypothetical protein IPI97_00945 [Nitrosomonas sp.]|nr:hypothetical protein [Nitrosomonas sp.]MBK7363637.1 hypothetical protein [Nitrosomonas sp.]